MARSRVLGQFMLVSLLLIGLAAGLPGEAEAAFIGAYDPSNWTTTLTGTPPGGGGAEVDTSGAPNSIALLGGDGTIVCEASDCTLAFTIHAPGSGLVTFHWAYTTSDEGPFFDKFLRTSNGSLTQLSDDNGAISQSGDDSFSVAAGNVFGFVIDCTDCVGGGADVTISEFSAPSAVPEPSTLLLLGSNLAGLGLARWRRRREG